MIPPLVIVEANWCVHAFTGGLYVVSIIIMVLGRWAVSRVLSCECRHIHTYIHVPRLYDVGEALIRAGLHT